MSKVSNKWEGMVIVIQVCSAKFKSINYKVYIEEDWVAGNEIHVGVAIYVCTCIVMSYV